MVPVRNGAKAQRRTTLPVARSRCAKLLPIHYKCDTSKPSFKATSTRGKLRMDIANQVILIAGTLILVSVLAGMVSSRIGAPLLLVFLALGMLAGEDGPIGLEFDDFGFAYLICALSLAVILFDGGLRTPYRSIRTAWAPASLLATVGVLVTAGLTGVASHFILGLEWLPSLLIGAIVASTDAAAVFLLLHQRGMTLHRRVSTTLEVESGVNDPMAVFLTVSLVELITQSGNNITLTVLENLGVQLGLGAVAGVGAGYVLAWVVNRIELAQGLYPVFVVSGALVVFGGTQELGGSGFLAVYLAGIVAGNQRLRASQIIRRFHDGLAWIGQIVMFVLLGLLVTPRDLVPDLANASIIAVTVIFVARPVAVFICLAPFRFTPTERLFVAWVGLRGAVPIFLAIIPVLGGVSGSMSFFNVAFLVVLTSLLLQGWTVPWLARWLKLELPPAPEPRGRLDIDLFPEMDRDLVGYQVREESPAAGRQIGSLGLPARARVLAVLRENVIVPRDKLDTLTAGDYVLLLCPANAVDAADLAFAQRSEQDSSSRQMALGEFFFEADTPLGSLADVYDLPVPTERRDQTVGVYLEKMMGSSPTVGDTVRLGEVELLVSEVTDDRVTRVGLRLDASFAALVRRSVPRLFRRPLDRIFAMLKIKA